MIHLTKIIAAILVLVAIALGGYAWILSRQPKPPPVATVSTATLEKANTKTHAIVVAAKAIPAGTVISTDALRVEQLPLNPVGSFKDTAPLIGRVSVLDLGEGTPLQEGLLVSGLALRVNEGERALAIKADEVMGVGNKVQPGDFVDVFIMLKSEGKDIDRSQARLLLARKRVLAFGNSSVDSMQSKTADGPANQTQRVETARTAVLAVPVEEINRLTLGESSGRLLLALRNPTDLSEPDPKLFADLPTALQPVASKPGDARRPPLAGLDRAQAGLTVADLVTGGSVLPGGTKRGTSTPSIAMSGQRQGMAQRPGLEVEVIRGDRSETLRY